jgi:hypothetical protein
LLNDHLQDELTGEEVINRLFGVLDTEAVANAVRRKSPKASSTLKSTSELGP